MTLPRIGCRLATRAPGFVQISLRPQLNFEHNRIDQAPGAAAEISMYIFDTATSIMTFIQWDLGVAGHAEFPSPEARRYLLAQITESFPQSNQANPNYIWS